MIKSFNLLNYYCLRSSVQQLNSRKSKLVFSFKPNNRKDPNFISSRYTSSDNTKNLFTMDRSIKYLNQEEATEIDKELMGHYLFSLDQLMELAGLSVATALAKTYPLPDAANVLVCCGPGNNGGDGLVCARHLKFFGYNPSVFYPKQPTNNQFFDNLRLSCLLMDIPVIAELPPSSQIDVSYNIVVDALFGFSFKPPVRPQFAEVIQTLKEIKIPLCSIDIPSGWDVEKGDPEGLQPEFLISLTAPKKCAEHFKGKHHWLGGRFVPDPMSRRLNLPTYPGTEICMKLS